jgi:hypothetical protein
VLSRLSIESNTINTIDHSHAMELVPAAEFTEFTATAGLVYGVGCVG